MKTCSNCIHKDVCLVAHFRMAFPDEEACSYYKIKDLELAEEVKTAETEGEWNRR